MAVGCDIISQRASYVCPGTRGPSPPPTVPLRRLPSPSASWDQGLAPCWKGVRWPVSGPPGSSSGRSGEGSGLSDNPAHAGGWRKPQVWAEEHVGGLEDGGSPMGADREGGARPAGGSQETPGSDWRGRGLQQVKICCSPFMPGQPLKFSSSC